MATLTLPVHEYTKDDFVFTTHWNGNDKSTFDEIILNKWTELQAQEGIFKYKLEIDQSKVLPGKFGYLAQLNTKRAMLRRKPVEMQSMKQKFDGSSFNFTKMCKKEILFQVLNKDRNNTGDVLAINVSPLEFGHCLLLPSMHECLPQVITEDSLLTALELFLLSKSPAFRMGFNGLCAYASLNHLHYHVYYLDHLMPLETIEVEHLAGPCYTLTSFPSRGFAFQLSQQQDIKAFVSYVYKLVSFLQDVEQPYNIFVCRGSSFEETAPTLMRDHVRLYVWARKPVYGAKEVSAFHPALCEMFGHLLIKKTEDYDALTEGSVSEIMEDLTEDPFKAVLNQVKQMFE